MIVVDVESTGVDARLCSLLSVGALDFENPVNQFYMECRAFSGAHMEKEALKISGFTEEAIRDAKKPTDREVAEAFLAWMKTCGEWTLAGQNPSFDRGFLEETAHRYHINWPLAHRTIDLHSICYFQMQKQGREPPRKNNHSALNLDRILEYVGLPTRETKHHAFADAKLEAEALSRLLCGKNLLPEYASFGVPGSFSAS
ncbi:MAG: DNA polymerase III subunit epsilon [Parcubacteria group bacterium Greene0416_79]|nr:MAG: DNA polymerase III subunit epsilon [Parcubacteria group bacterium Greene0416_79]